MSTVCMFVMFYTVQSKNDFYIFNKSIYKTWKSDHAVCSWFNVKEKKRKEESHREILFLLIHEDGQSTLIIPDDDPDITTQTVFS